MSKVLAKRRSLQLLFGFSNTFFYGIGAMVFIVFFNKIFCFILLCLKVYIFLNLENKIVRNRHYYRTKPGKILKIKKLLFIGEEIKLKSKNNSLIKQFHIKDSPKRKSRRECYLY